MIQSSKTTKTQKLIWLPALIIFQVSQLMTFHPHLQPCSSLTHRPRGPGLLRLFVGILQVRLCCTLWLGPHLMPKSTPGTHTPGQMSPGVHACETACWQMPCWTPFLRGPKATTYPSTELATRLDLSQPWPSLNYSTKGENTSISAKHTSVWLKG